MKQIKLSNNLEFDVIYDDGDTSRVKEGILFEVKEDNSTVFHIGTSRPECYDAFFRAVIEMMENFMKRNEINE